jgi:hypothetical protein
MIAINLNQPISCEGLCGSIQNFITKYQRDNPLSQDLVLVITVKEVSQVAYPDLPKLEHKS